MIGLAAPMIWLTLVSGLAPDALERSLELATAEGHLPLEFALAVARGDDAGPGLYVQFHRQKGWLDAFFQQPPGERPRLWLYEPYYLDGLRLLTPTEMRLDVAEYLFHALVLAYFERVGSDGLGAELVARANLRFAEVPEAHRREAFFEAAASFASHALAVANEIERLAVRRRAAGGDICGDLHRELPLYALWERIFTSEPYPGSYWSGGTVGQSAAGGRTFYTHQVLDPADKALIVESVLGGRWEGTIEADLVPRYCP